MMAICVAAARSAAEPQNPPQEASQIWLDGQFAYKLRDNVDVTGLGTLRLGRGLDHFVYERAGAAVSIRCRNFLVISPSYNYVASQPLEGTDTREHRLDLDGILYWHLPYGFDMSDRNRFERRAQPTITYFRYMNRLLFQHPVRFHERRYFPYMSDEIYYDGHLATWSRNRFSAGVGKRINSHLLMEFYYLRQNDHYSRPGDINAFGISFKTQLPHMHL